MRRTDRAHRVAHFGAPGSTTRPKLRMPAETPSGAMDPATPTAAGHLARLEAELRAKEAAVAEREGALAVREHELNSMLDAQAATRATHAPVQLFLFSVLRKWLQACRRLCRAYLLC